MDFISTIKGYLCPNRTIAPTCMSPDTDICPVCQEDLNKIENESDKVKYTTPCNHTYHHKCVKEWFKNNNTCPSCRETVITPNIRCSCTRYEYVKPTKEITSLLFFYYLIGGSSIEYKDVDKMMTMALDTFTTTGYKILTTFSNFLFFSRHLLMENDIKKCKEILTNISKALELIAILFCFVISSFVSGPIVTNWFRLFLVYQFAHYEGNFQLFKYSKKVFYDHGINPIYFLLYILVVMIKIPLFVLPSYFIVKDPYVQWICFISLFCFITKYTLNILDALSEILMAFYNMRISLGDVIRKEFNGESTPLTMYRNIFNSMTGISSPTVPTIPTIPSNFISLMERISSQNTPTPNNFSSLVQDQFQDPVTPTILSTPSPSSPPIISRRQSNLISLIRRTSSQNSSQISPPNLQTTSIDPSIHPLIGRKSSPNTSPPNNFSSLDQDPVTPTILSPPSTPIISRRQSEEENQTSDSSSQESEVNGEEL